MKVEPLQSFELPPDDLPEPGKQEWLRVMQQLQPLGVLTAADLSLLKSYCRQVAVMEEASSTLDIEGHVILVDGAFGPKATKNPWVAIYNDASDRALKLAGQFGFTPSARTKIVVPTKAKKEDGFSDFD